MYDFSVKQLLKNDLIKMGFKGACLVKQFNNWDEYLKAKKELDTYYKLGVELKPKNTRELINKAKQFEEADYITINNPDNKIFRTAVEKSLVDSVSGLELIRRTDKFHQRATVLDNITAKLMAKNKVSMVIEFSNLKQSWGLQRAITWGRMKYNTWICIKKKVPIIIASGAKNESELIDPEILSAFGQLLGMNAGQAKQCLTYVQEKIINRHKH